MKLTDAAVRKAKPEAKPYKLADGGGMYLEVMPNGSKYWRVKYRYGGKEKRLAFGVYPDVPLALARECGDEARRLLANDTDPGAVKQAQKAMKLERAANSFEAIALGWSTTASLVIIARKIARTAWSIHHYKSVFDPERITKNA